MPLTKHLPTRLALLSVFLLLAACGGSDDSPEATASAAADDSVAASDIGAFHFTAVAGHETGLRYLAKIDGRIATGYRNDVEINYGNGYRAAGLLHNCSGIAQSTDCEVWGTVTYDTPGIYTFSVTYQPPGLLADPVSSSARANVVEPSDFVIVSIGDSVASGEGNPVHSVQVPDAAHWDDLASNYLIDLEDGDPSTCHRSVTAGPAQAANRIARTNDATFIHIACSGGSFGNAEAGDKESRRYQLAQIKKINLQLDWVRERFPRIDVLLLSGGANNVQGGFSKVVKKCVLNNPLEPCSEDAEFVAGMASSIAALEGKYADLDNQIRCGSPGRAECEYDPDPDTSIGSIPAENQVPTVVAITEYFDPTRDSSGNFPGPLTAGACAGFSVGPQEWEFLYNNMVVPLNEAGAAAAAAHSWVHVGGIADAYRTHGYCAYDALGSPSWVVAIGESLLNQGDEAGTAHPNAPGQATYNVAIYNKVIQANPPRTVATGLTAGQPYTFGTWVADDVEVTLTAYNPIKESGVSATNFAVDDPQCNTESVASGACTAYNSPIVISESGRHTVSFFSRNKFGAAETRARPVEVLIDKEPPAMTCVPSPDIIWPPNGTFAEVELLVTAVDEVSGPADYVLVSITASEGNVATDVQDFDIGTADTNGSMLARRKGNGEGRAYTLTYESQDAVGNVGTCAAVVVVPHDANDF